VVLVEDGHERHESGEGRGPGQGGEAAPRAAVEERVGGPQEGEGDAEQEPERVRVGAVVDAGGVLAGRGQECHGEGGGDGQPGGHAHAGPPRGQEREEEREEDGPEQVELLLHGERPEVGEQLRGRAREVGGSGRDLEPVRGEGEGARGLAADADQEVLPDEETGGDRGDDDEEQGRQEPACPALPEGRQVQAPPGGELTEEQGGDEEPGDHEEHVDSEETARQARRPEVEHEDGGDGEGAQAVEPADLPRPGRHAQPGTVRCLHGWSLGVLVTAVAAARRGPQVEVEIRASPPACTAAGVVWSPRTRSRCGPPWRPRPPRGRRRCRARSCRA